MMAFSQEEEGPPHISQYFKSRHPSSTLSASLPVPAPSTAIWLRKLSLQSEELAALIKSSSTKLEEHQQALSDLLISCSTTILTTKTEIKSISQTRSEEVDSHLSSLRRLSQTSNDLLSSLSAKLSLLETLPVLHSKLHSHDLMFSDLVVGQKALLHTQDKITATLADISAKQDKHAEMLQEILCALAKEREEATDGGARGATVKPLQLPLLRQNMPKSKFQRRLLSDEDTDIEFFAQREVSTELLSFEQVSQNKVYEKRAASKDGEGGGKTERPLKRKLLNTADMQQFVYADGF